MFVIPGLLAPGNADAITVGEPTDPFAATAT
jgi:hypothetical protein